MTVSAIAAADEAFTVLAVHPAPLAFDAHGIAGLPDRHLDLLDLRALLTSRTVTGPTTDLVWRRLAIQARSWGPAWVVAAVGVAMPGLSRVATRLAVGTPQLAEDIDSEVVAGFLQELRGADLDAPRVWLRLLWAAWRSGRRVCPTRDVFELPEEVPVGASTPRVPYGHPDLLLGRAVAAGIITAYEADLIGDTRLGDVLVEQLADQQGLSTPVLRMRRQRAERRLIAALSRGRVGDVVIGVKPSRDSSMQARLNGLSTQPDGCAGTLARSACDGPAGLVRVSRLGRGHAAVHPS